MLKQLWLACAIALALLGPATSAELRCFSGATRDAIRSDPSRIAEAFTDCEPELASALSGMDLNDDGLKLAFSAIAANGMAPYGASEATTFQDLLAADRLHCAAYALLASYFVAALLPSAKIEIAGFDGGAVGNHAQIFAPAYHMLLDPTIGLIAIATFDEVLSGKAIPADKIRLFKMRDSTDIDAFSAKVHTALVEGRYRPSNILYVYHGIDQELDAFRENTPLWKAKNIPAIIRTFPTPASDDLEKNLRSTWSQAK